MSVRSVRAIGASFGMVGVLGIGYALWVGMAPGEERKMEMLKNLPEANPLIMEETRRRNVLMMQVLKEAAETNENIARRAR